MSRKCQVSGKSVLVGNHVSHSNIKTKRRTQPNLQNKRFWSPELKRFIALRVCTSAIRTIDKLGFDKYCRKMNVKLK